MILRYDQGMNTHHEPIDHNHPAVEAAARVGRVSDEAEIAASEAYAQGVGERPFSQRMRAAIIAALPHLIADDLRDTPAGKQLMAEGWEECALHLARGSAETRRVFARALTNPCLLYTSPSPRDRQKSRMPSSA